MSGTGSAAVFIIVAFCFAGVLIFKKETIPPVLKRGLAITALFLVVFAFFLLIYELLQMKTPA